MGPHLQIYTLWETNSWLWKITQKMVNQRNFYGKFQ